MLITYCTNMCNVIKERKVNRYNLEKQLPQSKYIFLNFTFICLFFLKHIFQIWSFSIQSFTLKYSTLILLTNKRLLLYTNFSIIISLISNSVWEWCAAGLLHIIIERYESGLCFIHYNLIATISRHIGQLKQIPFCNLMNRNPQKYDVWSYNFQEKYTVRAMWTLSGPGAGWSHCARPFYGTPTVHSCMSRANDQKSNQIWHHYGSHLHRLFLYLDQSKLLPSHWTNRPHRHQHRGPLTLLVIYFIGKQGSGLSTTAPVSKGA